MLDVSLLPAFTRLGHECQDLLSPRDRMHVCTDCTSVYTLIRKRFWGMESEPMLAPRENPLYRKNPPQRRIEPVMLHHAGQRAQHTTNRVVPAHVLPFSIHPPPLMSDCTVSRLYAVGGRDGSSCLKSVECFDPHTNKWTHCTPMAKRRGGVGVATCNGFLYAVGGHEAPATNPTCSRYDSAER